MLDRKEGGKTSKKAERKTGWEGVQAAGKGGLFTDNNYPEYMRRGTIMLSRLGG